MVADGANPITVALAATAAKPKPKAAPVPESTTDSLTTDQNAFAKALGTNVKQGINAAPKFTSPERYQRYITPPDSKRPGKLAGTAGLIFLLTRGV